MLWQEHIPPLIALEFVSGNGSQERDKTPWTGKFWIYEQGIRPAFYGIYEVTKARVEVYCLVANQYQLLLANERGHYSISPLSAELGIWQGEYQRMNLSWLRWWDAEGNLLLTGEKRVILAEQQIQAERQRAEQERQRAEQLAAQLRALGVNPDL